MKREHFDLLKAWIAISMTFAVLFTRNELFAGNIGTFGVFFIISLFTVGIGFIGHEMSHKYVAIRYGCHAEFRAFDRMLLFALLLAAATGFTFIAPGAVFFYGTSDRNTSGKVSLAGPLASTVIALLFLALGTAGTMLGTADSLFTRVTTLGFRINSWLAFFNMLPFFGLDGEKVLAWKPTVFWAMIIATGLIAFVI
jgi:Zn-dependent protease